MSVKGSLACSVQKNLRQNSLMPSMIGAGGKVGCPMSVVIGIDIGGSSTKIV